MHDLHELGYGSEELRLAFDKVSELDQMGIIYQTESFLTACISLVDKLGKP